MNTIVEKHGKKMLGILGALLAVWLVGKVLIWDWMITRVYCEIGYSLMITRKTGDSAPLDAYADKDKGQQGVQEQMKGPGRHFLNPFTYSATKLKDIVVKPGEVCLIKNNIGKDLPSGRFIADAGEKGTLRAVLSPGTWRINPHGQTHERVSATNVRPGYVGVQTLRENRIDPNTGKEMYESDDIAEYLYREYGAGAPPRGQLGMFPVLTGSLASGLRGGAGTRAEASVAPEKPLVLWSFEASPFCRIVRERLCVLEIPYVLHNVGRGSAERQAFVEISGKMQVPFLVDPNTGESMFESAEIVAYLDRTYAR